jgi:hypothetical protein
VLGWGCGGARKDNDAAERYYRQALRMDSGNSNAVRGLANIYRAQSPEKASQFIQSLSASQRRSIDDIERSLTNEQLSPGRTAGKRGQICPGGGNSASSSGALAGRCVDNLSSFARSLQRGSAQPGRHPDAPAGSQKPTDPDQVYASGLYLSGNDQDRAALAHLNTLPRSQWNGNIQELADRLQSNQVLETANRLRDSGKEQEAENLLRQQPSSTRIDLTLADWAQQRGDRQSAKTRITPCCSVNRKTKTRSSG